MGNMDEYLENRIFTVPYIDKMISENSVPDSFFKCIKRYVASNNLTVGEAISIIYQHMSCEHRNEYYYKNTILNELLVKKHDLYTTAALTELPIANSKADFVMINGKGVAYEIKTDLDNLLRLDSQINDYYKVFSYVNVVVSKRQLDKVKTFLSTSQVGIYELTQTGRLINRKTAGCNRKDLSYEAMFQLLRKGEFENILLRHYKRLPEVNSFQYYRECQRWMEKINILTLQKNVMSCLKQRTLLTVNSCFEECIPYELMFYAYFSKKHRLAHEGIQEFWDREVRA